MTDSVFVCECVCVCVCLCVCLFFISFCLKPDPTVNLCPARLRAVCVWDTGLAVKRAPLRQKPYLFSHIMNMKEKLRYSSTGKALSCLQDGTT